MASIRKRGRKWQAQVRRHGSSALSKTFFEKSDALKWALSNVSAYGTD